MSHLDYAADGIWNVTWATLIEVFPIFFLFAAICLLGIAIVVNFSNAVLGAKVAFVAAILAWLHYAIVVCVFLLAFSIVPFLTVRGMLGYVVPILLLIATTRYLRLILKTTSHSGATQ
jgi:hypothetical protein